MWTAHVTKPLSFQPGILHLHPGPVTRDGRPDADVTSATDFAKFVEAHPEIASVIVYDSRFPRRAVVWQKFIDKHSGKIWKRTDLVAALREVVRQRLADPNYVPTITEALAHPKEFVDGMNEETP